ncbi:MAG TPA: hypothetical protein VHD57_07555 [Vicinamibacterales bacterium]|jgi:hypothetical protein|nr:hypothetical protein [Vicinamibacterales bacterium]
MQRALPTGRAATVIAARRDVVRAMDFTAVAARGVDAGFRRRFVAALALRRAILGLVGITND